MGFWSCLYDRVRIQACPTAPVLAIDRVLVQACHTAPVLLGIIGFGSCDKGFGPACPTHTCASGRARRAIGFGSMAGVPQRSIPCDRVRAYAYPAASRTRNPQNSYGRDGRRRWTKNEERRRKIRNRSRKKRRSNKNEEEERGRKEFHLCYNLETCR